MTEPVDRFLQNVAKETESRSKMFDRLLSAADSSKVFGQPVTCGEYTVITASEVASGGGYGLGMGFGLPQATKGKASESSGASAGNAGEGGGGGTGGGGGSMGRPVAAITLGPDGVTVKPVVDVTKVGLAALTALGAMGALLAKSLAKR